MRGYWPLVALAAIIGIPTEGLVLYNQLQQAIINTNQATVSSARASPPMSEIMESIRNEREALANLAEHVALYKVIGNYCNWPMKNYDSIARSISPTYRTQYSDQYANQYNKFLQQPKQPTACANQSRSMFDQLPNEILKYYNIVKG